MTQQVVIVGAGGFGRQCLYLIEEMNAADDQPVFDLLGFVDDNLSDENAEVLRALDTEYIGTVNRLIEVAQPGTAFVVSIANPRVRQQLTERFIDGGLQPVTLMHPDVRPHRSVRIGQGCVISKGVNIAPLVTLADGVHINMNCTIGHDAQLEDYVTLSPLVSIGGFTRIQAGAFVGANAAVLQNLTIGQRAVVGAAACVTRDVLSDMTVKGAPAR